MSHMWTESQYSDASWVLEGVLCIFACFLKKHVKWLYYNHHSSSQNKKPTMPTESRSFINRTKCISLHHGASSDLYELFLLWNEQSRVWYHNTCFVIYHFGYQCKELGLLIFSNLDQKAFCKLQKQGSGIARQFATWEKYYIVDQSWLAATILFPKDFFKIQAIICFKSKCSYMHAHNKVPWQHYLMDVCINMCTWKSNISGVMQRIASILSIRGIFIKCI